MPLWFRQASGDVLLNGQWLAQATGSGVTQIYRRNRCAFRLLSSRYQRL